MPRSCASSHALPLIGDPQQFEVDVLEGEHDPLHTLAWPYRIRVLRDPQFAENRTLGCAARNPDVDVVGLEPCRRVLRAEIRREEEGHWGQGPQSNEELESPRSHESSTRETASAYISGAVVIPSWA